MERHTMELTRGEEQVMQILWHLDQGSVNDLIAAMEEPKPKHTTVATFIKILENKNFIRHEIFGKGHLYYPLITKEEYARNRMSSMLADYFDGSLVQVVLLFSKHEDIPMHEMEQILEIIKKSKTIKRLIP